MWLSGHDRKLTTAELWLRTRLKRRFQGRRTGFILSLQAP